MKNIYIYIYICIHSIPWSSSSCNLQNMRLQSSNEEQLGCKTCLWPPFPKRPFPKRKKQQQQEKEILPLQRHEKWRDNKRLVAAAAGKVWMMICTCLKVIAICLISILSCSSSLSLCNHCDSTTSSCSSNPMHHSTHEQAAAASDNAVENTRNYY